LNIFSIEKSFEKEKMQEVSPNNYNFILLELVNNELQIKLKLLLQSISSNNENLKIKKQKLIDSLDKNDVKKVYPVSLTVYCTPLPLIFF